MIIRECPTMRLSIYAMLLVLLFSSQAATAQLDDDKVAVKANPEKYEQLDTRKVSDKETWAHLAVCGDEVYVRSLDGLIAFRWR